jgi:hypothetical protein
MPVADSPGASLIQPRRFGLSALPVRRCLRWKHGWNYWLGFFGSPCRKRFIRATFLAVSRCDFSQAILTKNAAR